MATAARLFAVFGLSGALGCGGGSGDPTGSPTPTLRTNVVRAGSTLIVLSADTGLPVSGARVVVAGSSHATSGAGQITLAEDVVKGSLVDIVAEGFLDRQTLLRSDTDLRFSLWPRVSAVEGFSEQLTAEVVYTALCCPPAGDSLGRQPLRRVRQGATLTLAVQDAPSLRTDEARRALQEAVRIVNAATVGSVVFSQDPPPPTGASIQVMIDDAVCTPGVLACMSVTLDGQGYISGGRLVLTGEPESLYFGRSPGVSLETSLTGLFAHELGHATGLFHSSQPGVMYVLDGYGLNLLYFPRKHDFSDAEKLILRLMYQRRPKTTFPDNDRSGPTTLGLPREERVCEL